MLEFRNVTFKYDEDEEPMMRDLSFSVGDGEFVSIIGASGCGKSTIFRLINGLEKPQSGEILVNGKPIETQKNYSSFMPQKDLLLPWRTIEKNVCLPMEIMKVPADKQKKACKEALEQVGLSGYADKYPKDLSGGRAFFSPRLSYEGGYAGMAFEPVAEFGKIHNIHNSRC